MILAFEMTWSGTIHAPGNSGTIQTIAQAYPGQEVRVLADASHLAELRCDPALVANPNVSLHPVELSPLHRGKTHVVSGRRFAREQATIRAALGEASGAEPCLIVLLSATPTAILAALLAVRLSRRRLAVQVGLHGNLNELTGWRPRNPLTRRLDLAAMLAADHPPAIRYLVLEQAVHDALGRIAPTAAARTDVLPHPITATDAPAGCAPPLTRPLRIGFVGQATRAKGFDEFVAVARAVRHRHGDRVAFHHVGRVPPGADLAPFADLADPPSTEHLGRPEFVARLAAMHYVMLPFQESYYNLSASGALLDAVTWLKPVITTPVPLARSFFQQYGDIGYLGDGTRGLIQSVEDALSASDARYERQVRAMAHARDSRTPRCLAATYRAIVDEGFGGLFAHAGSQPSTTLACLRESAAG